MSSQSDVVSAPGQEQHLPNDLMLAVSGMTQAIEVEMRESSKRPSSSVRLRDGKRHGATSDGAFEYRFQVPRGLKLRPDTGIKLRWLKKEVEGLITDVGDGHIRLEISEDLGEALDVADMISDDSWLLRRLRDKLKEVSAGQAGKFNLELAAAACGVRPAPVGAPSDTIDSSGLNQEQAEAVQRATGLPITFVWGPPGTGKTQVLARIARELYLQGKSVLLVANANRALDTLLQRVCEELYEIGDKPFLKKGSVLRLGPIVSESLYKEFSQSISLEEVAAREVEGLKKVLNELEAEEIACRERLKDLGYEEDEIKDLKADASAGRRLKASLLSLESEIETKQTRLYNIQKGEHSPTVVVPNLLNRLFRRPSQIPTREALQEESHTLSTWIRRAKLRQPLMLERLKAFEVAERQLSINSQIKEREKRISSLQDEAIDNCQMLAVSLAQTYLSNRVPRHFDVVIVDEASMVPLPAIFWAAGLAQSQLIIAGDFCQLPPIVTASRRNCSADDWKMVDTYLRRDPFDATGVVQQVAAKQHPPWLAVLSTQYRMRASICEIANAMSYTLAGNPLKTSSDLDFRERSAHDLGKGHLFYIDTGILKPVVEPDTRRNSVHAEVVRGLLAILKESTGSTEGIGVISPYRDQVDEIQHRLISQDPNQLIPVATVHSFQGSEKDFIILDLVAAKGLRPGQFLRGVDPQDDGTRLLNVAVSRARDNLLVIADFKYLRSTNLPKPCAVRTLLDIMEKEGQALDPELVYLAAPTFEPIITEGDNIEDEEGSNYRDEVDSWESMDEAPPVWGDDQATTLEDEYGEY